MKQGEPFNVLRDRNSWSNAPRAEAVVLAVGGFANAAAATAALGTFGYGLAVGAAGLAISVATNAIISALTPAPPSPKQSLLVNARDAAGPQEFVYGETRKGGTITYLETTRGGSVLYQVIALAAHEIESVEAIYINDEVAVLSNDAYSVSKRSGAGWVTNDNWSEDGNEHEIRIFYHLGDQTAITDTFANSSVETLDSVFFDTGSSDEDSQNFGGVGQPTKASFVGNGIAYLFVRFSYATDVFKNGIPVITAKIRGKKVFDPRTSTTAYSNNAALCIRDFLTSSYGLNDPEVDDTVFQAAANTCDEAVTLDAGGTEKRYTMNGVVRADQPYGDVLQEMVKSCAGTLFWGAGKWKLQPGEYNAPTKTFTLDDLRSEINLQTRVNLRDQFNRVQGVFSDANQRYIAADYPPIESATFLAQDDDVEQTLDLDLPFTTSAATAQRLAKMTLFRGREQMTFSAEFGLNAFDVEVGEIVALTIDRYNWTAKEFEVVGWRFGPNQDAGDLRVTLTLRETSEAAFAWDAEESEISSNDTDLTASPNTVTNLTAAAGGVLNADGTFLNAISTSWDLIDGASSYVLEWRENTVDYSSGRVEEADAVTAREQFIYKGFVEILYRQPAQSGFDYYNTGGGSSLTEEEFREELLNSAERATNSFAGVIVSTRTNAHEIVPVKDNTLYDIRVRAISSIGQNGPWTATTFSTEKDNSVPAAPTNLVATAGYGGNEITWDGVTSPLSGDGDWATFTSYVVGDTVNNNSVGYICISDHNSNSSTEPGVGVDWELAWEPYVERLKDLFLYEVYRGTTTAPTTLVGRVTGESFSDTGLDDSTEYFYRVKSRDFSGNVSAYSTEVSVTTKDLDSAVSAELSAPSAVVAADNDGSNPALPTETTMTVSFGGTDDTANWTFSRANGPGVTSSLGGANGNVLSVTGLTNDSGYVDITASKSGFSDVTKRFIIAKSKQGEDGISTYFASVFRRDSSTPSTPSDGSYNFGTKTLTPPSGWSTSVPSGTDPVYTSTTLASVQGTTGIDSSLSWSAPVLLVQDGATGDRGPGRWYIDIGGTAYNLPIAETTADNAWNATTSQHPARPEVLDQIIFYEGTQSNPTKQQAFICTSVTSDTVHTWNEQEELIDGDLLVTGTITADKLSIGNTTLADDGSGNLVVGTITDSELGSGSVSSVKLAANLESDNYEAGSSGWQIDRANGDAEFNDVTVRGTLDAANVTVSGTFDANIIKIDGSTLQYDAVSGNILVKDGGIGTTQIANDAIEAGKIASSAVTTDKIDALAVNESKIASSAVTVSKIADAAVEAGKIASGAVTEIKIATSAITETKIASDAVTTPKIAAGAVTAGEISAGAITTGKIAAGVVTASEIAAGTITSNEIATNTITSTNIAAGAITATEILAGAVTADKVAANAITSAKIAAGTIQASDIAAGTITANEIATSTISADRLTIGDSSLTADDNGDLIVQGGNITVLEDNFFTPSFPINGTNSLETVGGALPFIPATFIAQIQVVVSFGHGYFNIGGGSDGWGYEIYAADNRTLTAVTADELVPGSRAQIVSLGTTDWNVVAGTTGVTYAVGDYLDIVVAGTGTGTAYQSNDLDTLKQRNADEVVSGDIIVIDNLGTTTDWNALAGTTGVTYQVGDFFEAVTTGSGDGVVYSDARYTLDARYTTLMSLQDDTPTLVCTMKNVKNFSLDRSWRMPIFVRWVGESSDIRINKCLVSVFLRFK